MVDAPLAFPPISARLITHKKPAGLWHESCNPLVG